MTEVMRICDLTGHSGKAFIEECVRGCIASIHAADTPPLPPIVMMARAKMKKTVEMYRPHQTPNDLETRLARLEAALLRQENQKKKSAA